MKGDKLFILKKQFIIYKKNDELQIFHLTSLIVHIKIYFYKSLLSRIKLTENKL